MSIIPKNIIAVESNWQKELANVITDPAELLRFVEIDPKIHLADSAARKLFPMRVPYAFARRMAKGDIHDPLLKQVMPLQQEFEEHPEYLTDPLMEQDNQQPGILHKYQSRVLLLLRGGCAVNCRYCFRRHFPYQDNAVNRKGWEKILSYIAADEQINEVIFSGGDPLMAKDSFLAWLAQEIANIPHVKRLRVHTRLPVVIPQRVCTELIEWMTSTRLQPVMVLHVNHANELDQELSQKLLAMKQAGITLLNQSVLLADVNDQPDALVELSERLFACGILPYYLHLLDKVQGASHFAVSDSRARELMAEMIKRLPGFLVPKLVREIGGQPGKTPVDLKLHP